MEKTRNPKFDGFLKFQLRPRCLVDVSKVGAFGQPGVERVLELLRIELRAIMQQIGAPSIKHLTPAMVRPA